MMVVAVMMLMVVVKDRIEWTEEKMGGEQVETASVVNPRDSWRYLCEQGKRNSGTPLGGWSMVESAGSRAVKAMSLV